MKTPYYPLYLKLQGKKCVVIGGGQVALRKVRAFLEHGADVDVVSPELCPELDEMAGGGEVRARRRNYRSGDLEGAVITVAATGDRAVNARVVREANERRVLVNVVDDADSSDFIVPSYLTRGDVAIAVSTGGKSPALARKIRTALEASFGEEYAALADMIEGVRGELKKGGTRVTADDWQTALELDKMIELLRKGDGAKARALLVNNLKQKKVQVDTHAT